MTAIICDVIANILGDYGSSGIEKLVCYLGGRPELSKLENTMSMIQAWLVDAERQGDGEGEVVVKEWLKGLKRILYRLEDLLEEIAMDEADQDEQMLWGKLPKRLCTLIPFSRINRKAVQKTKDIMEELENYTWQMRNLNFGLGVVPCVVGRTTSRETHSFAVQEEVIGRDEDKIKVVQMLFDSDCAEKTVSVIPIVGIGGLGKTALCQLVFNDENVKKRFELRCWVCISANSSLKELVRKILESMTDGAYHSLNMEQLQIRLRDAVNDKRYLLVLDDIWHEGKEMWDDLKNLLRGSKHGSKIIVTSRSRVVAQNMGTVEPYELKGLPENNSWELFRRLAFREGHELRNPNRARIGQEIVKKCANVPLIIKTVGCLLQSMDTEREWEYFQHKGLTMVEQHESSFLSALKLSYNHLPAKLKPCFAICSLFPKNHLFSKEDLIHLWMAQGFLGTAHGNDCPEIVGHSYFMQLLRRCFFQDVVRDSYGEIIRCKMHNLVHDLAHRVAEEETLLVDGLAVTQHTHSNNWHVSISIGSSGEAPSWLLELKQIRSLLLLSRNTRIDANEVFSSLTCLRALDLGESNCKILPDSIQELKHLRYLKFASPLKCLPECITRLQNLQTLDFRGCHELMELPRGFSKLINLRHLHNRDGQLVDFPPHFGQLTSLRTLDKFIVGDSNGLDALANLKNVAGCLKICIVKCCGAAIEGILKDKKLNELSIEWSSSYDETVEVTESALNCLQPPPSLKRLGVANWRGVRFPSWGMNDLPDLLPNLISIEIEDCRRCQDLPPFSRLPHLESLYLRSLNALECMEFGGYNNEASYATAIAHFPSLQTLELENLPELKGWSKVERNDNYYQQMLPRPSFPLLSVLIIRNCPKLISMPVAPKLESLEAKIIDEKLLSSLLCAQIESASSTSSALSTLRSMKLGSVQKLESLSINLCSLEDLEITNCRELTNMIVQSPTSLRRLSITRCGRLRDISYALQHLSVLEELSINKCNELDLENMMDDDNGGARSTSWQGLKSLHSLTLWGIAKLDTQALMGVACVSTLCDLSILDCPQLTALPQSFRQLTSLQRLCIRECPEQEIRCQCPDGQDWPLIQHIPHIHLGWPSSC